VLLLPSMSFGDFSGPLWLRAGRKLTHRRQCSRDFISEFVSESFSRPNNGNNTEAELTPVSVCFFIFWFLIFKVGILRSDHLITPPMVGGQLGVETQYMKEKINIPQGSSYTDLWSRPGFLIRRLHQLHAAIFIEECRDYDVTPVQYAVLSVLYKSDKLDQVSVAAEVGIDRNNAADVLRRLERRGFLESIPSVVDKRAKLNRITKSGRSFVEDAHGAMERAQSRLTMGLNVHDRGRFVELLQKVMIDNNHAGRAPLKRRHEAKK